LEVIERSQSARRRFVLDRVIRELDRSAPLFAERLRWRRAASRGAIVQRVVDQLVGPGGIAMDIGAHRGYFSARLLQLVGPTGSVHAFEPNPVHLPRLRVMARRQPNLLVHAVALSDRGGSAELMVPVVAGERYEGMGGLDDPWYKLGADFEAIDVPVARADDFAAGGVSFVKCDVEGHEVEVFAGAERILAQRPTLLVEIEHRHRDVDPHSTIERLTAFGLEAWAVFQDGLRPASDFDLERDQLAHLGDPRGELMPQGYVNDFLFTRPGTDLADFLAPRSARP
jgi:FkbM family methyltransferase